MESVDYKSLSFNVWYVFVVACASLVSLVFQQAASINLNQTSKCVGNMTYFRSCSQLRIVVSIASGSFLHVEEGGCIVGEVPDFCERYREFSWEYDALRFQIKFENRLSWDIGHFVGREGKGM